MTLIQGAISHILSRKSTSLHLSEIVDSIFQEDWAYLGEEGDVRKAVLGSLSTPNPTLAPIFMVPLLPVAPCPLATQPLPARSSELPPLVLRIRAPLEGSHE